MSIWNDLNTTNKNKLVVKATARIMLMLAVTATTSFTQAQNDIKFSGFATLALSKSDTEYQSEHNISSDWDFFPDSAFGLQADTDINDRTRFTLQVVARGHNHLINTENDKFKPDVEWAFTHIQINENNYLRLGRFRNPLLMFSDALDISYAYNWIKPPYELYDRVPDSRVEGLSIHHDRFIGEYELNTLFYTTTNNNEDTAESRNRVGFTLKLSKGNHSARLATSFSSLSIYTSADKDTGFGELYTLLTRAQAAQQGLQFSEATYRQLEKNLNSVDMQLNYANFGYQYDNDKFSITSEIALSDTDSGFITDSESAYISLAYQLTNQLTPHITFGSSRTTDNDSRDFSEFYSSTSQSNIVYDLLDDSDRNPSTPLLDEDRGSYLRSKNESRQSITTGIRWDYAKRTALKADIEYISKFKGSDGFFEEARDLSDKSVLIYRLALTAAF